MMKVLFVPILFCLACSQRVDRSTDATAADVDVDFDMALQNEMSATDRGAECPKPMQPIGIPNRNWDGICDNPTISADEYVSSSDGVFFGTVTKIEPVVDLVFPVTGFTPTTELDSCSTVFVALRIELSDVVGLDGRPVPATTTVTIGQSVQAVWYPQSTLNACGEVSWNGDGFRLGLDQQIGGSFRWVEEEQTWTTQYELFEVKNDTLIYKDLLCREIEIDGQTVDSATVVLSSANRNLQTRDRDTFDALGPIGVQKFYLSSLCER